MFSICPSIYWGFVIPPPKYKAQPLEKKQHLKKFLKWKLNDLVQFTYRLFKQQPKKLENLEDAIYKKFINFDFKQGISKWIKYNTQRVH